MGTWYTPEEDWPQHAKSWWRETLDEAKANNWHLLKFTDHGWGKISCSSRPNALERDAVCVVPVDGTALGGETHARIAKQKVRSCPHRELRKSRATGVRTARELIADAEGYLKGAQRLISERRNLAEARELLARAVEDTAAADLLFEQAGDREARAGRELTEAKNLLRAREYDGPVSAPALLAKADHNLDQALPHLADEAELLEAHRAAIAWAARLREQLSALE